MAIDCTVCELVAAGPQGGWHYEDEHWAVAQHQSTAVPGWTTVYLRRHAAGLSDMTTAEQASLGRVLANTARAIEQSVPAERVYLMLFAENAQHVHIVLAPRGPEVPPEHRSARLHVNAATYVDPGAARDAGERIRSRIQLPKH